MVEYYGHNDWRDYHLSHHGVLGMHWGIRRYQPYGVGYQRKGGETGKVMGEARRYNKIEKKITRLSNKQARVQAKADKYRAKSRSTLGRLTTFGDGWNETQFRKQKKADRIGRKINRLENKADKLKGQSYGSQYDTDSKELRETKEELSADINRKYREKMLETNANIEKLQGKYSELTAPGSRASERALTKAETKLAKAMGDKETLNRMKDLEKSSIMKASYSDLMNDKKFTTKAIITRRIKNSLAGTGLGLMSVTSVVLAYGAAFTTAGGAPLAIGATILGYGALKKANKIAYYDRDRIRTGQSIQPDEALTKKRIGKSGIEEARKAGETTRKETYERLRENRSNRAKALAASGYTQAEIAKKLGISPSTVSDYINS